MSIPSASVGSDWMSVRKFGPELSIARIEGPPCAVQGRQECRLIVSMGAAFFAEAHLLGQSAWLLIPPSRMKDSTGTRQLSKHARADATVAVSQTTADAVFADSGTRPRVIHNWIDATAIAPGPRNPEGRPLKLLFVGNPSKRKGSDFLPQLARELGNGFEIEVLQGLRSGAVEPGWPTNIKSRSRVPPAKMPDVYREADAVLVLARYEAFGYVALEALTCGRPVIGFDTSGTSEICVNNETGFLVPVGDIAGIANGARRLVADPLLWTAFSDAGRHRAVTKFGEEGGISAYLDVYEGVCLPSNQARSQRNGR